ncbi:accessory gene regulator B family protein [Paenibacillus sp. YYML68]|uniref:accessory gene regulator B family protein n=1 Tax=Paenibacillus sp. YYML68 TaxID=2909250 RepID=UPI002492A327|nr:accessory gene regulator B family protein [Paenibacillus sp. YYML68]
MNFIDRSALSLTHSIRKHNSDAASETVLFYALSLLINSAVSVLIVMTISTITGKIADALLVILAYTILRIVSGGLHLRTSLACCLTSATIFLTAAHAAYEFAVIGVLLNTVAFILVLIYAPSDIKSVSRIDPKYYPMLKCVSALIVASNFYFQLPVLTTAFLIQALLTTPFMKKAVDYIEGRLY